MALHDDQVSLQQMRDGTRKALSLVAARSQADLADDWVATLALMQLLQIIGEAARRLSESLRQQHSSCPGARSSVCETDSFTATTRSTRTGCGKF